MFERDEQEISRIVAEGLEAILSGESTLEDVLAAHPEQAAAIRPELEAARWLLAQQVQVQTRPGFVAASRERVVARIQAEAADHNAKHAFLGWVWPQRLAYRWVAALSLFLVILSGLGGIVTVSQDTLPGDDLYQVKRAYEQVAITVTTNEAQRASLAAQFSRRRLDEARALINKGDYAAAQTTLVEFEQGVKQAITLLQKVSDQKLNEKQDAAVVVQQNLSNNADQLTRLVPSVPTEILGTVIHARDTSVNGIIVASRVIDEVKEKQSASTTAMPPSTQPTNPVQVNTPVIMPSSTSRPTSQPTAVFVPPVDTPVPPAAAGQPPANPPGVTLAPTQIISTVEPSPTVAPSDTPTDIPSPTETPVPATPTEAPSSTPLPTDTPQPSDTPTPDTSTPVSLKVSQTPISEAASSSQTPTPTLGTTPGTETFGVSSTSPAP